MFSAIPPYHLPSCNNVKSITVIFLFILLSYSNGFAQQDKYALIIGNSKYLNVPLQNPANDARDMAELLKQNGFTIDLHLDISLREMKQAMRKMHDKLQHNSTALFYFAGHGMQYQGNNYLIPVDADIQSEGDIEFESLNVSQVLGHMNTTQSGMNIVILDACRNNPFARSFRSLSQGLAQMDAPTGTLLIYATAPNSVSHDGNGRNGVFTKHLLNQLQQPHQYIEQVLKQVRVAVMDETGGQQVPWESSSLTGNFSIKRGIAPRHKSTVAATKAAAPSTQKMSPVKNFVILSQTATLLRVKITGEPVTDAAETILSQKALAIKKNKKQFQDGFKSTYPNLAFSWDNVEIEDVLFKHNMATTIIYKYLF